ncbi:hypothetical protein [Streptomyces sp. NBC_00203]|uniref:hypothetical protein n=1 Tax=Streptomyces sp. NBC_00203 TaxID=2975680 RepID=UPI00324B093E
MTERTTHLDPDPRDWRSRKILVRPHRWYATVELDRDGYVDTAASQGHDPELPAAYREAVDRARDAYIDRIWYDGYSGDFSWGDGPRWVTLFVPFPHVKATVEALRVAELDHDYSRFHALADRLALPVDDWLAPGERELIRGVDFDPPPGAFLRFLRGKAKKCGVRLNGRGTAGPGMSSRRIRRSGPGWAAETRTSVTARNPFSSAPWRHRAAGIAPAACCGSPGTTVKSTRSIMQRGRSASERPRT